MIGIVEMFFFVSMLLFRGRRFGFGKNWHRVVFLFLKLLQIHTVCYQGLWLSLGIATTMLIKAVCEHDLLGLIPEFCDKDWNAYARTTGAGIFATACLLS